MAIEYVAVEMPRDRAELFDFLCGQEWLFHLLPRLGVDDVLAMDFTSGDVASFWIREDDRSIGLVRAFDLGDIGVGAPLFDIRIAAEHRGRGVGTAAVEWLTCQLFTGHPELHRVEATTRHDNVAMQRVLERTGYQLEGRLREAWPAASGDRFDTLLYGILRTDWSRR